MNYKLPDEISDLFYKKRSPEDFIKKTLSAVCAQVVSNGNNTTTIGYNMIKFFWPFGGLDSKA